MRISKDDRTVLTLDAGGTSFRFLAVRGGRPVTDTHTILVDANDLDRCLRDIIEGFTRTMAKCPQPPVAISFAFPGPCDYPAGIIGDLGNLPCFRGGVALGPMLEAKFNLPVFINNDGDLFCFGEAIGGLLPEVNRRLAEAGSPKRFKNLFGVTFGTGFGGGLVHNGDLFVGDNASSMEIWCTMNGLLPDMIAEEGVSIRAIKRVYSEQSGEPLETCPDPLEIEHIATGKAAGNQAAAIEAYRQFGVSAGRSMAQALTLCDALAVIGGGLSKAVPLYLKHLVNELNGSLRKFDGETCRRVPAKVYNLEDPSGYAAFLEGDVREIDVPCSDQRLKIDPLQRIGVGLTRLGTSEAISMGAYAFALKKIEQKQIP